MRGEDGEGLGCERYQWGLRVEWLGWWGRVWDGRMGRVGEEGGGGREEGEDVIGEGKGGDWWYAGVWLLVPLYFAGEVGWGGVGGGREAVFGVDGWIDEE